MYNKYINLNNMSKSKFYDKIIDLADNVQRYVHVTEHNVATIYQPKQYE